MTLTVTLSETVRCLINPSKRGNIIVLPTASDQKEAKLVVLSNRKGNVEQEKRTGTHQIQHKVHKMYVLVKWQQRILHLKMQKSKSVICHHRI